MDFDQLPQDDDEQWQGEGFLETGEPARNPINSFFKFILQIGVLASLVGVVVLAFQMGWIGPERELILQIQEFVDLEQDAVLAGDGPGYLALQATDPSWISAQLKSEHVELARSGPTVVNAVQNGDFIWATLRWRQGEVQRQRIAFFQTQENGLIHIPTGPVSFWGPRWQKDYEWGTLVLYSIDKDWEEEIAEFVTQSIVDACASDCLIRRLPLEITLAANYSETAEPSSLRLPSPRLVDLDSRGRPGALFWARLNDEIISYLKPVTIRFAVLPWRDRTSGLWSEIDFSAYQAWADDFMALHSDITVELVRVQEQPTDLTELVEIYDGINIRPTEAMLAAGLVRDLTDFVDTDPRFDRVNFHAQVWQGALWQDRLWVMPQAATMRLLYFDRGAYGTSGYLNPDSGWTWDDFEHDVQSIAALQPEGDDLMWGFLSTDLDIIISYAHSWDLQCIEIAAVLCQNRLEPQDIAQALDWYTGLVAPNSIPDFSVLNDAEREQALLTWQGANRRAAIWTEFPVDYERQILLSQIGVVPFPGTERFAGITPLTVYGSFISSASEHPRAVWEWLNFLSYQRVPVRLIPARPSVALEMNYWDTLPNQLGEAMQAAFPFALPLRIEEENLLTWSMVEVVLNGSMPPQTALELIPELRWFGAGSAADP